MPAISPRTQAMGQMGGTDDQAKTMFAQGLSQMAYNVLLSKLPNVAPDVVTFKVLETDHEAGSGVGAFVLIRRGQTVYVPVVMADNQIKPLDILYYKDLNAFMPLSKEWLEELDKQSMGDLGQGATPPKTMATDVDIRNTVVPPTTGRYSYAADATAKAEDLKKKVKPPKAVKPKLAELEVKQAGRVFDEARNQGDVDLSFLSFLSQAPNRVKQAAAKLFETRPGLLKQAVWFYGEKPLVSALKLADYGGGIKHTGGALYVADEATTAQEFKDIFGSKSPAAFSGVKVKGYYAKDDRKRVNKAIATQPYLDLHEPKDAGAYKLWKKDGKPVVALVIANPINLFTDTFGKRIPARNIRFPQASDAPANPFRGGNSRYRVPGVDGLRDEHHVDRYIGITEDGDLIDATRLIGTQVALSQLEGSDVFKKTVGEGAAAGPRKGQRGIFVQKRGATFVATSPVTIESITSDFDGGRRIEVLGPWGKKTLVTDSRYPGSKLMVPTGSDVVYLPSNFTWFPVKNELTAKDFLTHAEDVFCWTTEKMLSEGAEKVKVSKLGGEPGYMIGREYAHGFVPALKKLASSANISLSDAELALKTASAEGRFEFWSLAPEKFEKSAAEQQPQQADPAQQAMDQMQMAQMQQPQGPSPVDMAVAEQMQMIQGQMQALQQMQQMVQTIQQRASMIAGGGGAGAAPAAAAAAMGGPMDPSMMGAGMPVPGMDPNAQGGPPQQGMDPNAQMGQMDPNAQMGQMGGMPQDPNAQQQPPQAMMSADDGSVETLSQQINPQFMEQAGQLDDAGTFDAAALASMAQSPSLKELVAGYLPNLEKSLDNLGRVLLTLWMDETRIKGDIGDEAFISLEDNLRSTFRGMGELILKINQNTTVLRDRGDHSVYQG